MNSETAPLVQKGSNRAGIWIALYFIANLTLTIHNKWVLNKINFKFPWFLTAIHISVSGLGSFLVCRFTKKEHTVLDFDAWLKLVSFSFLYAINIAMSNVSMAHVSLSFHQIVRSSVPAVILMLECVLLKKNHTTGRKLSLIPLIIGVGLATVGEFHDLSFTYLGLWLTLLGVGLAALKGVATNVLMVGPLKLHPLQVIYSMAIPATIQCLVYGYFAGELTKIYQLISTMHINAETIQAAGGPAESPVVSLISKLALNGALAFLLNWVSFTANQKTSALTMTVVANVKQIASISLAIYIFQTPITPIKLIGIVLTLAGASWYR